MSPIKQDQSGAENIEPTGVDLMKMRKLAMTEMQSAKAVLLTAANEFNGKLKYDNNNQRRVTMSPGNFRRAASPLLERKSSRLSGKPIIDYTGLDFEENMKGSRKTKLSDDNFMSRLSVGNGPRKRRHTHTPSSRAQPVEILSVEDVTEEMIKNINYCTGNKVYSAELGKSCHQCRQKTIDTKSVCRSGFCFGVRGQFCGACLKDHYGEDLAITLRDPKWSCPMCREICNCSFCRKRAGKLPLGQISGYARSQGYESVHHFLVDKEGKFDKGDSEEEAEELKEVDDIGDFIEDDEGKPMGRKNRSANLTIKFAFRKPKRNSSASNKKKLPPKSKKDEFEQSIVHNDEQLFKLHFEQKLSETMPKIIEKGEKFYGFSDNEKKSIEEYQLKEKPLLLAMNDNKTLYDALDRKQKFFGF
ncbi:cell division cycle-associated protein 7-like [Neocloeon triangulifer]|uniref:cell division cycle-associated protein 7-like n=1 Tax=Neocloeon triangulifer TaxID=2078957 RepID=UPI00286ECEAA|nr:cell division cycle-associated protein 7-like [Neocloeon triangulifer]